MTNREDFSFAHRLASFFRDEKGATAMEWGLIALLIAVAIIGAMQAVATSVSTMYSGVSSDIDTAM